MDDDLEQSSAGMAGLLTGHRPVQETLIRIAEFARSGRFPARRARA